MLRPTSSMFQHSQVRFVPPLSSEFGFGPLKVSTPKGRPFSGDRIRYPITSIESRRQAVAKADACLRAVSRWQWVIELPHERDDGVVDDLGLSCGHESLSPQCLGNRRLPSTRDLS